MTDQPKNRIRLFWLSALVLAGVAVTGAGFLILQWRTARAALPVLGGVPDFSFTERSGRTVARADLTGQVWIADFIFTRCAGPCPAMSAQLAQLQRSLAPSGPVRLVSFTVDPDHDTPAVLTEYADRFGASAERWWFLTGKKESIYTMATQGFHLAVQENPSETRLPDQGPFMHSTRFVLVDRQGRIRGYYSSEDNDVLSRLLGDIGILLRENACMISISDLPAVNATLNATTAILLLSGFVFIRRKNIGAHKASMILATLVSGLFLISYLVYHFHRGATRFSGQGWSRLIYFSILIPHTILAMLALAPLVVITLRRAWRSEFVKHRRIARWTFPLWLYVSVTGLIVYWMLYHLYPVR